MGDIGCLRSERYKFRFVSEKMMCAKNKKKAADLLGGFIASVE